MKNNLDEQRIIKRVQAGELSAFENLVKKYQKAILYHSLRILKDIDKAKDATQEAFIRAYKNIRKFKIGKPFSPWIYKIATNICYDMIKKSSKIVRMEYDLADSRESFLDRLIHKEQISKLLFALKGLPNKYKEAIDGYYFKNLTYKDLAVEMQLPINTVKTHIRRGKMLLRRELV